MATDDSPKPWNSHEDMGRYNSLFPLLPDYTAHYTVGGEYSPRIGIPDRHSIHLAEKLLAVLIADRLQIETAYAEKKYVHDFTEIRWLGLTEKIDALYKEGRQGFGWYVSFGMDCPKREGSFQDLSMQFFYRNVGAFDASKRLSELGYLCEVATILRSALEQFALCANLWDLDGKEELPLITGKQSFNRFKQFVPAAGQLYGLLSKYTHFEYDHHTHFFAYSPSEILTVQRGPVLRAYATHLIFLTMVCVATYILKAAPQQFSPIPESVTKLNIFIKNVNDYSDQVCSILKLDSVLANFDILLQKFLEK